MYLILTAFIIWCLITFKDLWSSGYNSLLNPFFWTSLLFTLYFIVPSFFVEQINYYFFWNLALDDITYSNLMVSIYSCLLSLFYLVHSSKSFTLKYKVTSNFLTNNLMKYLWVVIFGYLLYVLFLNIRDGAFLNAFIYDNEQSDPYKLKNIAYIFIPISTYVFWRVKKYWVFLPNVIIMLLDLIAGSRTIAMIALIPIILNVCYYNKRLYVLPALTLLLVMLTLGVLRSDNIVSDVPWYLNAIGEFRETYITLPLYISNSDYVGNWSFFEISSALGLGLLQPFRAEILNNYTFAGDWIASDVARGYGLGSNLLIEAMYYGHINMLFIMLFFLLFVSIFYRVVLSVNLQHGLVLVCFFVIFVRLIIREGFYLNLGLLFFVLSFYWMPIVLLLKIRINNN
ncbi:hypothetical protein [Shewanella algae]